MSTEEEKERLEVDERVGGDGGGGGGGGGGVSRRSTKPPAPCNRRVMADTSPRFSLLHKSIARKAGSPEGSGGPYRD